MIHVRTLEMHNWLCYRGLQRLELEPKAYAVVARRADNPESSNWAGKTSLVEAVHFALTGQHRHRTEDEWITRGEKEGLVRVVLSDGLVITRERIRGKSTRLSVGKRLDGVNAEQAEGERKIQAMLGLTEEDLMATCFFEQRQMARLILARPEERMRIISAWLRLEKLQACEERARIIVSESTAHASMLDAEMGRFSEQARGEGDVREVMRATLRVVECDLAEANAELAEVHADATEGRDLAQSVAMARRFDEVVAEGQRARAEAAGMGNLAELGEQAKLAHQALLATSSEMAECRRLADQKRTLALGKFNGACPVSEGRTCPVTDTINGEREENAIAANAAAWRLQEASLATQAAERTFRTVEAARQAQERVATRLETLRAEARRLKPHHDRASNVVLEDPEALQQRFRQAQERVARLVAARVEGEHALKTYDVEVERLRKLRRDRAALDSTLEVRRAAFGILGKNGAQRRLAEGALGEIEAGANEMLTACGIDLRVGVSWAREGSGFAKACDACGAAFPASTRVKRCERCGAARGPHLVNKLEVVLSDRSGAAEDLAGAAVQLSASAWLRADRASGWSTALIDEPFGQLDGANRRAFAGHLATLLRGRYGFEQALVIAHHSSVLDALPGRIEIVNEGGNALARVIS